MTFRLLFFLLFLLLYSCSKRNDNSIFVSEKVDLNQVNLTSKLPIFDNSKSNPVKIEGLDNLLDLKVQFLTEKSGSKLEELKSNWNNLQKGNNFKNTSSTELNKWFEITALLLEITGEARFASELEKIIFTGIGKNREENKVNVAPYVYTKNTDNLFLHIFTPSIIKYTHTTKGQVNVEMETDYPQSGKVDLKFGMTERRYIELNIRIPDWAEGTTVTVKKVKYLARPGEYCKIAKKWKDGDVVEIEFPLKNLPDYLKI